MVNSNTKTAILMLQDGTVFRGKAIGKIGTSTGEIAFNTSMTGYQEVFSDPSYFGQVVIMTNSHIGNYGANEMDMESESIKINGLICKKFSEKFSRKMGSISMDAYMMDNGLVGISEIDTRQLVRHVREKGAMNCVISSETEDENKLKEALANCPDMSGLALAKHVSTKEFYTIGETSAPLRVALMDYGTKRNIAQSLANRDCHVGVFPHNVPASKVLSWKPDGILLSNGPGDPAAMHDEIAVIKELIASNTPIFGICLGHQLLSLASGLETYKMHHGHRGSNHPVLNKTTGRSEITSQNHGFAVRYNETMANTIELTHVNLNDDTVEGIRLKNYPAFSVQHHPEANPGPHDSWYLFDEFITLIKKNK